ncbi:vascular endothelial growth factor A, long form isoform X1 [Planococcus citri]|uniref:vascular endothelial growth factor A, long form isoform X1 n=1 Tax=Planococcus citri TaxID=170843 RepID=UPI0031F7C008
MRYMSIFVYCAYFAFALVLADRDDVVFPDSLGSRNRHLPPTWQRPAATPSESPKSRLSKSIPLDMIMRMNSITKEEDFINQFIEPDPLDRLSPATNRGGQSGDPDGFRSAKRLSRLSEDRQSTRDTEIESSHIALNYASLGNGRLGDGAATSRFGGAEGDNQNEKKAPSPKPANCQPELRTVNLRDVEDPTLFYFPSCTRVDRCGGCCSHDLLSCQPTNMDYKNFSVIVAQYTGSNKLEPRGRKIVTVETHTKCKCDCKIKAKDCTSLQQYNKSECRCVCTNKEAEIACHKDKLRLWNPSTCSCPCRETLDCSTGLVFDDNSCSCVAYSQPFQPSYNTLDRTRYSIGYPQQ